MASKFKHRQKEKREALCQRLVSAFLPGLQDTDPTNFNLAYNFVAQNLEEPALSVNPRDAETWLGSLADRCDVDSQPDKAGRLRALVAEISRAGLKSDYEEPEARILLLLIGLSGRPLDTSVERAAAAAQQVQEQRLAAEAEGEAARARQEAELFALIRAEDSAGDEDDEQQDTDRRSGAAGARGGRGAGGYASSSSSTLSDWSDDETEAAPAGCEGAGSAANRWAQGGPPGAQAAASAAASGRGASPRGSGQAGAGAGQAPGSSALVPAPRQEPISLKYPVLPDPPAHTGHQRLPPPRVMAPAHSLRARLVGAAGLPLRVAGGSTPLPRTLLALLAALQGRSSELIPWDPLECSFRPRDDLYLAADVSYGAVRTAVRPLLRAATGIRRLGDWMDSCLHRRHTDLPPSAAASRPGHHASVLGATGPGPAGAAAGAAGSAGLGSGAAERGLELPAWLLHAAGIWGRSGAGLRLVQGPTLQALHQAVSTCLHALRTPLVLLEQRVTNAACCPAPSAALLEGGKSLLGATGGAAERMPSLYELIMSCQPYIRRAASLVAAYLEVAKPLVTQLMAASNTASQMSIVATTTATAAGTLAIGAAGSGGAPDGSMTARLRASAGTTNAGGPVGAAAGAAAAQAAAAAGGGQAGSGGSGPAAGRSVYLQLQAGSVLERLHAMNERGWLDGVFMPLESHAHRCMVLYLYLSALDPLLEGLAEWLWTSGVTCGGGGSAATGAAAGAAAAGGGSSELPADFFVVRGGGPGREVPADHPAFWREGYIALPRPSANGPATATASAAGTAAASSSSLPSGVTAAVHGATQPGASSGSVAPGAAQVGHPHPHPHPQPVGGGGAAAPAAATAAAPYLCPPFLEPLVPSIMAAGKSLRLRQREADSMEASAAAAAGSAGPGYATAGSAVLDPVALEQSYAMYGLSDDPGQYGRSWGSGSGSGGGKDLKRGLMERLLSYLSSPGTSQAPGATLHSIFAADHSSGPGLGPATVFAELGAAPPATGGAALDTGPAAAAATGQLSGTSRWRVADGTPRVASGEAALGGPGTAAAGASVPYSGAQAGGPGVGSAGGLWRRMASSAARLSALCTSEACPSPCGATKRAGAGLGPAGDRHCPAVAWVAPWDPAAGAVAIAGGDALALVSVSTGRGLPGGGGAAGEQQQQQQQQQRGNSSPVTPLDCGGAASGVSSPEDCNGDGAGHVGGEDEMAGTAGGRWWPRRCELLLRQAAGSEALMSSSVAAASAGGVGRSNVSGPWHRMQQLLRAGPHAALGPRRAAQQPHAAGTAATAEAWATSTRGPAAASVSAPPGAALPGVSRSNAYQHPAMDRLLMHACGLAQPLAEQQTSAGGAGALVSAAGGGGGGGGADWGRVAPQPLGLPHPHELLTRGLVEPLQDRADHVNDALLLKLLGGWGLETRLAALPSVFLLSSPAVRSWADQLVSALLSGMRLGERPLEEQQLEQMLQEALSSAGPDDLLPPANSLVLSMAPVAPEAAGGAAGGTASAGAGGAAGAPRTGLRASVSTRGQEPAKFQAVQELERSVAELERLQLGLAPSWVVALVADSRVLRAYSQVLVFMLQLRWVRAALDAAHKATCLAWRERETRAHPNSWPPLRRPGAATWGPQKQQQHQGQPHHQRSHSASDAAAAAAPTAAAATGASGAAAGGGAHLRGSGSIGSLSGLPAPGPVGRGPQGPGGGVAAGAGPGGAAPPGPRAAAARIQSSLAAMLHFMATLEQWVATQLVHDAWVQLEQDLASARSLDDVCSAHSAYTVTLLRRCFRYSGEEGSRHMGAALRKCLDECLRFAAAISSLNGGSAKGAPAPRQAAGAGAGGTAGSGSGAAEGGGGGGPGSLPNPLAARLHEEALRAADNFSYWLGYLVRFVSTRALMSPSSDLGDLLMRLNYNDCYSAHFMPEDLVAQQLAAQHNATAAARGWAACGPGPGAGPGPAQQQQQPGAAAAPLMPWSTSAAAGATPAGGVTRPGAAGSTTRTALPAPQQLAGGGGGSGPGGVLGGAGGYLGLGLASGAPGMRPPGGVGQGGTGPGPGSAVREPPSGGGQAGGRWG